MRIGIVGAPFAEKDVVMTGAVLGQHLLAVAGDERQADAGSAEARLQRLGHIERGPGVAHIDGDVETLGKPGLRQQRLGAGGIIGERPVVDGAEKTLRLERSDAAVRVGPRMARAMPS